MTKKEKTTRCKEILYRHKVGDVILSIEDHAFLNYIFQGHPDWESKKGSGVNFYSVGVTPYKNTCFFLNRHDGSSTDISFIKAISKRTVLADINSACRNSIRREIVAYRNSNVVFGVSKCPITGDVLTKYNTHIDHYNLTFSEVFKEWLKGQDVKKLENSLNKSEDHVFERFFTDNTIAQDFVEFHNKNTNLRAVTKIANLSILK